MSAAQRLVLSILMRRGLSPLTGVMWRTTDAMERSGLIVQRGKNYKITDVGRAAHMKYLRRTYPRQYPEVKS